MKNAKATKLKDVQAIQDEINQMIEGIQEMTKENEIQNLKDKVDRLQKEIRIAVNKLHGVSDLVEVMGFYVGDDDPRLEGSLDVINNLILEVWSDLKDVEK